MRQPAPPFVSVDRTDRFLKALLRLNDKERKRAIGKVKLLFDNPAHPSLNTHAVKPDRYYWEAYLNRGDRIYRNPTTEELVKRGP